MHHALRKSIFIGIVTVFLLPSVLYSQKKVLDENAWNEWNTIESVKQSPSGNLVSYGLKPLEGDRTLILTSTENDLEKKFVRASSEAIHFNDQFFAFLIKPGFDTIRKLELDKVKKIKHPKDTLAIYWPINDSILKIPNVKSFQLAEEGNWIAYLSTKDLRPKGKPNKGKKKKKKKKKKKITSIPTTGKTLFITNPLTGMQKKIHRVKSYQIDKKAGLLAYTTSKKGDKDSLTLHVMSLSDFSITTLLEDQLSIEKMTFDESSTQLIFLSSMDTSKAKNYALYYWKIGDHNAVNIVDSTTKGMPEGYTVSAFKNPYFSKSGDRIFLGTGEIRSDPPKDTLLASEKVVVDIWHYQDLKIQPEQLSGLKREKKKSYLAVFTMENRKLVQLADKTVETVRVYDHHNSYYGLGIDSKPYQVERTWTSNWKADYYKVVIKSGKRELIKKGGSLGAIYAPSGKYLLWFNSADSSWMSYDVLAKKDLNISSSTNKTFERNANGVPGSAGRSPGFGWTMINDEEYYLVSDKKDIWALSASHPDRAFCLTDNKGEKDDMIFSLLRTEYDSTYLILENSFVKGTDEDSRNESIYSIHNSDGSYVLNKKIESPHKFSLFKKAKESDKLLITRRNFNQYPDLESTDINLKNFKPLSDANPQQDDYNWGTVEHVYWSAFDSLELRGLLYKPEDFDSTKSYPMIVYFYSLNSQNIHEYYTPKPVYSYINFSEYVSNGYIIFVPDIEYGEPGHPGNDAYNCLISGTQHLYRNNSWIDSTRLGIQGQSWGGYQTVQLITMTNMFKAAMAGAAVGNMFSAYGGIRWTSGLARTFQYEEGQSRIGSTIWENPELYIENSPVFHLNKVNTPLFLRHNDKDGAVPWYQSIEIFIGLRRLQKPVWLLNYNGGDHWNLKLPHRIDYNIRMRQFFDHYLMGAPMPIWMKDGRPAINKDTDSGLELEK